MTNLDSVKKQRHHFANFVDQNLDSVSKTMIIFRFIKDNWEIQSRDKIVEVENYSFIILSL